MSVTFIASVQTANAGTADVSIVVPAGVTTSHFGILCVAAANTGVAAMTAPTGWTNRGNNPGTGGSSGTMWIFTRLGGVSAGQTVTVTLPSSNGATTTAAWFDTQGRDVAQSSTVYNSASADVSTVPFNAPGQSAATDTFLIASTRNPAANTWSTPAGTTKDFYGVDAQWTCGAYIGHANGVTSQSYSTTLTGGTTHNVNAIQLALTAPVSGGGGGGGTLVHSATGSATATSCTVTLPAAAAAGNSIVVVAGVQSGATVDFSSVTDSAGNTYVQRNDSFQSGSNTRVAIYDCIGLVGSPTTVTVTAAASTTIRVVAMEVSGLASFDVANGAGAASSTTPAAPSVTTTQANDFVVTGINYGNTNTATDSAGFTKIGPVVATGSTYASYGNVAAAGAASDAWTLSAAVAVGQSIAAYKTAVSTAPTFIGTTQYGDALTTNQATAAIPIPAGAAAGDVMLAAVEIQLNTTTMSSAPGWTTLSGPDSPPGTMNAWLLGRTLSAADITAGSVSVTVTVAGRLVALAHTFRNVGLNGVLITSSPDATATSNPVLPTQAGIPSGSALSVFFVRRRSGAAGTVTVPSPYTTAGTTASNNGTGTNVYIDGGYELSPPASEGGQTGTSGVSSVGINYLVVLPPASQNYNITVSDNIGIGDYPQVVSPVVKASVGATTVFEVSPSTNITTLTTPAGTQPGDLLVASFTMYTVESWDTSEVIAPSSDWQRVGFVSDDYYGPVTTTFILPVKSTPPASYNFTTAAGALTGMLTRVTNADFVNTMAQPPLLYDPGVTYYGASVTLPDETIVQPNVLALTVASQSATGTTSTMVPPASQTQQAANTGVGARQVVTTEFIANPGQLGQDTWTSSGSSVWAFQRFYINSPGAQAPQYLTPAIASTSVAESAADGVTSLVVPTPSGAQAGDVLLLVTSETWPKDITAPAGFVRAGVRQTIDKQTIAIDSTAGPAGTTGATTGTSTSWTHTVSAGARNRFLAVGVAIGSLTTTADTTVTVTVNGTALSAYGAMHVNNAAVNGNFAQLFVMPNPPVGALSIVVTTSTSVTIDAGSVCYTGVDNTNPYGQAVGISAGSAASSINTDSGTTPGNMLIALLASQQKVNSVSAPWTLDWSRAANTTMLGGNGAMASVPVTATSTSITWTFAAAAQSGGIMAELQPATTSTVQSIWWTQLTGTPPASYTVGIGDTPATAILLRATGVVPSSPIEPPVREDWSTGKNASLGASGDRSSWEPNTLHLISISTTDTGSQTFTGTPGDVTKVIENTGVGKKLGIFTRPQPVANTAMPSPDNWTVSDAAGVWWTLIYAPLRPSIVYQRAYTPAPADSVGLTDAVTANAGDTRTAADLVGLTDSVSISVTRSIADVIGITDIGSGGAIYAPAPADVVGATDTATHTGTAAQTQADLVGLTDAVSTVYTFNYSAAPADPVGLTDAVSLVQTQSITVADNIIAVDSSTGGTLYLPTPADAVGLSDAISFVSTATNVSADVVGLTDAVSLTQTHSTTVADLIGTTDSAGKGFGRTVADLIGGTDAASRATGQAVTPADVIGATDLISHVSADVVADPVGITDTVSKTYVFGAIPPVEQVGLTDAVTVKQVNLRTFAESVAVHDIALLSGQLLLVVTTTADTDVDTSVGMQDVVRMRGTASIVADFSVADLEKGPQRAEIDIEAGTSDLTHVVALSGTAGLSISVSNARLYVVHALTDIVLRDVEDVSTGQIVGTDPPLVPHAKLEVPRYERIFRVLR